MMLKSRSDKIDALMMGSMLCVMGTVILFLGLILIASSRSNNTAKINQTYNRATNCFTAIHPDKRTNEYVEQCYDKAENKTGVKIDRYGLSKGDN